jgi:hypothetical protein
MQKRKALATAALAASLFAGGHIAAQKPAKVVAAGRMLSAADYLEIQQLAVRYSYALDSGSNGAEMFANLFARDGVFISETRGPITGRKQLLALGRGHQPMLPRRFIANHVIQTSGDGAVGRVYVIEVDLPANNEAGGQLSPTAGRYEDVYVRTAEGWRFKSREFKPSKLPETGAASQPPPAAR